MAELDYNFGADTFPAHIELCGICGRRVHRLPPNQTRLYCENCGQAHGTATVVYTRRDLTGRRSVGVYLSGDAA